MRGRIVRLVAGRGFGFIRTPQGAEYFFHRSAVQKDDIDLLVEGDIVTFDLESDPGHLRPRAVNVTLVGRDTDERPGHARALAN